MFDVWIPICLSLCFMPFSFWSHVSDVGFAYAHVWNLMSLFIFVSRRFKRLHIVQVHVHQLQYFTYCMQYE